MAGTTTLEYGSRRSATAGDRYLALLALALLGYAIMGKGFAYIGFAPLYIGEILYLFGIMAFLRSGACLASLGTLPGVLLGMLMAWVIFRTVPFVGVYGFDAPRDSVIVIYGGFAFIVIALLLEDARRIDTVLRYYSIFVTAIPLMLVTYAACKYLGDHIPSFYGPNIPILDLQESSIGMHLAGSAVFALIGYRKVSTIWLAAWCALFVLAGSANRGSMVSVLVTVLFAMLMLGRLRLMLMAAVAAVGIFGVAYLLEASYSRYHEAETSGERPASAHQLVDNIESIFGRAGAQSEGTKQWRLEWWDVIVEKTFQRPNGWIGRGFGVDLAQADGFETPPDASNPRPPPPSRSPHSAHMNILARAGLPGFALWLLLFVSWGVMMLKAMFAARSHGHRQWADLFLFISCYAASVLINASVDVVLEGPQQGIWFWCLFGFGIGSVMVYRAQLGSAETSPDG